MDLFSQFVTGGAEEIKGGSGLFEMLLVLMIMVWIAGRISQRIGVPNVLGEIIAGILLGPLVLGLQADSEVLIILAELGVFFLMFHTGLDTKPSELIKNAKTATAVWLGSFVPVFSFSYLILRAFELSPITALFAASVLSLNSIPVITAFLRKTGLKDTKIGHTVHGASVGNEIMNFMIVSVLLSIGNIGDFSLFELTTVVFKVLLFFAGTIFLGQRILPIFSTFLNTIGSKGFTFALIVALVFGLFAEFIGLHIILGAYLGGIFVREEIYNREIFEKIEDRYFGLSYSFLGPIFFAYVGMNISFGFFSDYPLLYLFLFSFILFIQISGASLGAYLFGKFTPQQAISTGTLMVGRGGTEIIIAGVGFSRGILSEQLFSAIVVTTFFATMFMPLLLKIFRPRRQDLFGPLRTKTRFRLPGTSRKD